MCSSRAQSSAVQDSKVSFLELDSPSALKPVFTLFPNGNSVNSEIARAGDDSAVLVTNGRKIFSIGLDTKTATIASLNQVSGDVAAARRARMNWLLRAAPDGLLYVAMLARSEGGGSDFVGALDVKNKRLATVALNFPSGIDVDTERGVVYKPEAYAGRYIEIASFADGSRRRIPVSAGHDRVALSPDRRWLLLSGSCLDSTTMALLDVANGKETLLPFTGSSGTWLNGTKILFVQRDTEL
jgi:hypothetical protein